jgi:hypothetical protein
MIVGLDLEHEHAAARSQDHEVGLAFMAAHVARDVHGMENDPILSARLPAESLEDLDLTADWLLPGHLEIEDSRGDHPSHQLSSRGPIAPMNR